MMNSQKKEFISVKSYVLSVTTRAEQRQELAPFYLERFMPIMWERHLAAKKYDELVKSQKATFTSVLSICFDDVLFFHNT